MKKLLILIFFPCLGFSQGLGNLKLSNFEIFPDTEKSIGLTLGVAGSNYFFGEIGVNYNNSKDFLGSTGFSVNLTTEINYVQSLILAPKVQFSANYKYLYSGVSVLYYSQGPNQSVFVLRPELGLGLTGFHLSYGYNFQLNKTNFNRFSKHSINLRLLIPLYFFK